MFHPRNFFPLIIHPIPRAASTGAPAKARIKMVAKIFERTGGRENGFITQPQYFHNHRAVKLRKHYQ
jgi:hypothetical protein